MKVLKSTFMPRRYGYYKDQTETKCNLKLVKLTLKSSWIEQINCLQEKIYIQDIKIQA